MCEYHVLPKDKNCTETTSDFNPIAKWQARFTRWTLRVIRPDAGKSTHLIIGAQLIHIYTDCSFQHDSVYADVLLASRRLLRAGRWPTDVLLCWSAPARACNSRCQCRRTGEGQFERNMASKRLTTWNWRHCACA